MKKLYSDLIVNKEDTILFVLKKMDELKKKLLIVLNGNKFLSVISIGDIQRAIIKNVDLNTQIVYILRNEVSFASTRDDIMELKVRMKTRRNEFMPIVSPDGDLVDVIFWENLFSDSLIVDKNENKLNLPVIIMAGGRGSRLAPLTNVLPKPLIPIGKKTMIEDIMDQFVSSGCCEFYISVNYKADIIRNYLNSLGNTEYMLNYFQEEKPLGTAGSLHLLKDKIHSTFFVSNCDIIIDQNLTEVLEYHRKNNNEITIVAAIKNIQIPYGTIQTKENGLLESLLEKPEYSFKINTGLYILEPHLLNEIPKDTFYHITYLIEKLYKEGRRVGVFPISEGSWTDIGSWKEYLNSFHKSE